MRSQHHSNGGTPAHAAVGCLLQSTCDFMHRHIVIQLGCPEHPPESDTIWDHHGAACNRTARVLTTTREFGSAKAIAILPIALQVFRSLCAGYDTDRVAV